MTLRFVVFLIVLTFGAMLIASVAFANPFVLGDVPSTAAQQCVWNWQGSQAINDVVVDNVNGNPTYNYRVCRLDVQNAAVGNNTIHLALRDPSSMWGDSVSVPFTFARPANPPQPANLRLSPQ